MRLIELKRIVIKGKKKLFNEFDGEEGSTIRSIDPLETIYFEKNR